MTHVSREKSGGGDEYKRILSHTQRLACRRSFYRSTASARAEKCAHPTRPDEALGTVAAVGTEGAAVYSFPFGAIRLRPTSSAINRACSI